MKGSVCGHYLAIKPDEIEIEEEVIEDGVLEGFVLDTNADIDADKKNRMIAAATTGVVISVGSTCWKAYDHGKEGWKPWCEVGDRVIFVRHSAKIIENPENKDEFGQPEKIFILADENVSWNMGKPEEIS